MPYYFSQLSEKRLSTCHEDIQTIMRTVIQDYDFTIICGHRTEDEQNKLYAQGRTEPGKIVTNAKWPDSMHNTTPSIAVDIAPYPLDWENLDRFHELAGRVLEVAALLDIPIEWGGHWTRLKDYPHFQLPLSYKNT